jgi:hypothetical protein
MGPLRSRAESLKSSSLMLFGVNFNQVRPEVLAVGVAPFRAALAFKFLKHAVLADTSLGYLDFKFLRRFMQVRT